MKITYIKKYKEEVQVLQIEFPVNINSSSDNMVKRVEFPDEDKSINTVLVMRKTDRLFHVHINLILGYVWADIHVELEDSSNQLMFSKSDKAIYLFEFKLEE